MKKNIYEILCSHGLSIDREYSRLHQLFYEHGTLFTWNGAYSVDDFISTHFRKFDRRLIKRCLTFDEFNREYHFTFPCISPSFHNLSTDILVYYMEYLYNLLLQVQAIYPSVRNYAVEHNDAHIHFILSSIESLRDELGYTKVEKDGVTIFVNATPEVSTVAETLEETLAIKVFEYNHQRLKGDLNTKLSILKCLADNIELKKKELKEVNPTLSDNLFQMLQKFVRHNNENNPVISAMCAEEIEKWYDNIYNMWLLAKLSLANVPRNKEVKALLGKINQGHD